MPARSAYNARDRRGRARPQDDNCHDCKARIAWATAAMGHRTALDVTRVDPDERAYVLLTKPGGWRLAFEVRGAELVEECETLGLDVRTSHFDTCPTRRESRRPRERADLA